MVISIDLAVLLAVILLFRLRPSGGPRSAGSVQATALLALVLGLLLVGTNTGEVLLSAVKTVMEMLT
jgi:hypothetical protein